MWGKNHLGVLHHSIASRPADRLVLIAEGYLNICKEKVEPFRFLLIFIHLILIVRSDWAQHSTLFHIEGFRMICLYWLKFGDLIHYSQQYFRQREIKKLIQISLKKYRISWLLFQYLSRPAVSWCLDILKVVLSWPELAWAGLPTTD